MPVLERGDKKGWATIEYSPHHRKLTGPPAIRKLCFPVHPSSPYPSCTCQTWRDGLYTCLKPTTAGAFPALACLPSGGATPPRSSTKHRQPPGKGLQPRKARTSSAGP